MFCFFLLVLDEEVHQNDKLSVINEKRHSSQQSTGQICNNENIKRSKTVKKKRLVVDLTAEKKDESLKIKQNDNEFLKEAMIVQNYGNNTTDQTLSSTTDHLQLPLTNTNLPTTDTPSTARRLSFKTHDSDLETQQIPDNISTQMATTSTTIEQTEMVEEQREPVDEQAIIDNNTEQILVPIMNDIIENRELIAEQITEKQQPQLGIVEVHKRVKKGAFDPDHTMGDMVAFELGMLTSNRNAIKRPRQRIEKENHQNESETQSIPDNQGTLDLLEKIRQSSVGLSIGQLTVSQQVR